MKINSVFILFLILFNYWSSKNALADIDSQTKKVLQLENEKLALEQTIVELNQIAYARNMGYYIGIASAMLGFLGGAYGFYHQFRKAKVATQKLELAYKKLEETQDQLVKSEKLATFGVMATRLSHEILNPLNFVNNFSELSQEILNEIKDPQNTNQLQENIDELSTTLLKINEHGLRATTIVKELQDHTTKGTAHEFFEQP